MTDIDKKGNALDLCGMCSGEGKHNLLPPDGKFIRVIDPNSLLNLVSSYDDDYDDDNKLSSKERDFFIKKLKGAGYRKNKTGEYEISNIVEMVLNEWIGKGYDLAETYLESATGDSLIFLKWRWM